MRNFDPWRFSLELFEHQKQNLHENHHYITPQHHKRTPPAVNFQFRQHNQNICHSVEHNREKQSWHVRFMRAAPVDSCIN